MSHRRAIFKMPVLSGMFFGFLYKCPQMTDTRQGTPDRTCLFFSLYNGVAPSSHHVRPEIRCLFAGRSEVTGSEAVF